MEKISIYIDSGNFYHLVLKKLGLKELDFDFDEFAKFLAVDRGITKKGKRFYVGTIREGIGNHESKSAMANQTRLFTLLKKNSWEIKTSKLRTRKEKVVIDDRVENYKEILGKGIKEIIYERSREKGIDVKIAVDLIVGATDNKYDTAIIVSSDTDLVPAIDWVRYRMKKKVEYIGFSIPNIDEAKSTRPTKRMIYSTDVQRVLAEADLRTFMK